MDKPAIASVTLADIYLEQGHIDKSIEVYTELVRREPRNTAYKKRLTALKKERKNWHKGTQGPIRKILKKKLW